MFARTGRIPLRLILHEHFPLRVVSDDLAVDEAAQVELFRTELRHYGDVTVYCVRTGDEVATTYIEVKRQARESANSKSSTKTCSLSQCPQEIVPVDDGLRNNLVTRWASIVTYFLRELSVRLLELALNARNPSLYIVSGTARDMAQIFAAHDVAVIAGAFRPGEPTGQKVSLVWNSAGDRLLQSSKLELKFDQLLAKDERIPVASLSKSLDTRQTEWCLTTQQYPLLYSADRQSILGSLEADRLLADILESAQKQYTELESFLASHAVDKESFKARLARSELETLPENHSKNIKTWIATKQLHARTTEGVESLLRNSPDDHKTDLSAKFPDVPRFLLQTVAEQLVQQHGIKGTLRSGKTRITFSSAAYEEMRKEQLAKKVSQQMSKILVHTYRYGYHLVPENSDDAPGLKEVFFERTKEGVDNGSFSMIHSGDSPIAVAFTNKLEDVLSEIKTNACELVSESWSATGNATAKLTPGTINKLVNSSSNHEFADTMLEDAKYRAIIEEGMSQKLNELENADIQGCNEAFNEYVRLPIRLYLAGLNNIRDASLRQRLEDYVLEYMSKDLVPTGIQRSEDEKHLRDKTLGKELEKFGQSCLESNSLYELQTCLSKFVRKQKLESVSAADELEVKHRILQHKLKAMRRMVRGSDILQNLVWILLAREYDGLFISSGRDTTRMIKFYQSNGDAEVGERLEAWKDKFKAGQEAREDFEDMRTLAEQTVSQPDGRGQQPAESAE